MKKYVLFLISTIIILLVNKLADIWRTKWERKKGDKKEKYSILWHCAEFFVCLLVTISLAFAYKLPLEICLKYGLLFGVVFWIIYDLWWNITNKVKNLLYAGDGKGNIIEYILSFIAKIIKINYHLFVAIVKIILLIVSILIIIL
jgi:hypothetical protein